MELQLPPEPRGARRDGRPQATDPVQPRRLGGRHRLGALQRLARHPPSDRRNARTPAGGGRSAALDAHPRRGADQRRRRPRRRPAQPARAPAFRRLCDGAGPGDTGGEFDFQRARPGGGAETHPAAGDGNADPRRPWPRNRGNGRRLSCARQDCALPGGRPPGRRFQLRQRRHGRRAYRRDGRRPLRLLYSGLRAHRRAARRAPCRRRLPLVRRHCLHGRRDACRRRRPENRRAHGAHGDDRRGRLHPEHAAVRAAGWEIAHDGMEMEF